MDSRMRQCSTRIGAALLVSAALVVGACGSDSGSALSPGASIAAPVAQSPANSQTITSLSVTLTSTTTTATAGTLMYRFQVFNSSGTMALDSGLVSSPTWTTTQALTPNATYTWRVRGEAGGDAGSWSASATFKTGDPPPAYSGPIGNWEACAGKIATALVTCVHATINPTNSVGDFEVVKRVAWLLRGDGAGLLRKDGGENVVLWQGYSFSATRVCYPDGHIYKIIGDAGPGGQNTPGWADNDFVDDKTLYVPAIDPSKP